MTESNEENDSTGDSDVVVLMINQLVEHLGDHSSMTVDIELLLNATAAIAGTLIEAIPGLALPQGYQAMANHLATLMVVEAQKAHRFRQDTGHGLVDLALGDSSRSTDATWN